MCVCTLSCQQPHLHGIEDGLSGGRRGELPDQLCALDVPHLDHPVKAPRGQKPWREIAETENVLAVLAPPLPAPQGSGIKDLQRESIEEK